jgi:hypothetical protein
LCVHTLLHVLRPLLPSSHNISNEEVFKKKKLTHPKDGRVLTIS